MATGGLYQLIANDGAQDKLITASELLRKRLDEVRSARSKNPAIRDNTPTLVDIERTHLLFLNTHYKPFVAIGFEYNKTGVQEGFTRFGDTITYSIPLFGDFFNDMAIYFRLEGLVADPGNKVRYCEFLGHRLVAGARFEVNGNVLDQYDSNVMNFHYNFTVSQNKRNSWKRCVGQEIPTDGYLTQNPGDEFREVKRIADGPQTLKSAHPVVELWVPLLFWFNTDVGLSIPSVSIPYGQRFIRIDLGKIEDLVRGGPVPGGYTPPTITVADLYINNIFVNPEIHAIFIRRIGFSLIRVHRLESPGVNVPSDNIKLDNLKYPVETIYMGMRPNVNLLSMDDWHRYHAVSNRSLAFPVAIPNPVPPPENLLGFANGTFRDFVQTVLTLQVTTHSVDIYRETPATFFTNYTPYRFGNDNINTPDDIGMHLIPFNLYPASYQPSGHLNLSRTREFYIRYTSDIVSAAVPCTMVVIAIAINFLLVMDGSAALRFNT